MVKLPIYLDNAATTPVDGRVLNAMLPYFTEKFGNAASRSHSFGWVAQEAVDYAREQIAQLMNAEPKEIIFTSGSTEANNLALKGVFEMFHAKGNHIITVNSEHKSILDTCKHIENLGGEVTYLDVNENGELNPDEIEAAIKPQTVLISVMYANNETGVIHPMKMIGAIAQKHNIFFHTDATQAVGKIPVDVQADGIHLLSMSAHKMYGPKGTGCLYVRRKNPRVKLSAQIDGGGHEKGMRSGTLNVPGIVGFGEAALICMREMIEESTRLSTLRNKLEHGLLDLQEVHVNGNREHRLPHLTNLTFEYAESEGLMLSFNKELAVSSGSACSSESIEPSHVLKAMGLSDDLAHSSIRFSLGRFTTTEEIDYTIHLVKEAVMKLRSLSPRWELHNETVNGNLTDNR